MSLFSDKEKSILLIISIFYIIFFSLFVHDFYLWDQDEAAYAGFARRILQTNDWVTPDFLWSEPHRKTPFHFWAIAASFSIFGENEFALRLPSLLAFVGILGLQWSFGKRFFGRESALLSVLILAFSLVLPSFAKISLTDITLLFFQTWCAFSIIQFMEKPHWKTNIMIWFSMSLGILTKGPTIILMAGTMLFLLLIFHPHRWRVFRTHPWFGLPLALAPLLIWGRLAWLKDDGKFITWLLDWYILKRASGQVVFGQTGPIGYYVAFFILSFLPFVLFFPKAFKNIFAQFFEKQSKINNNCFLYISIWVISGWLMYEFIPSKLPSYAFAAMPPLAVGIAKVLQDISIAQIKKLYLGWFLQIFLVASLGIALLWIGNQPQWVEKLTKLTPQFAQNTQILVNIFIPIFLIINFLAIYFWWKGDKTKGILSNLTTTLVFLFFVWSVLSKFNVERSICYDMAQKIALEPHRKVIFTSYLGLPSLPFYVGKTNVYEYEKERNMELLAQRFSSDEPLFLVISAEDFKHFEAFKPFIKQQQAIQGFISDRGVRATWILIKN